MTKRWNIMCKLLQELKTFKFEQKNIVIPFLDWFISDIRIKPKKNVVLAETAPFLERRNVIIVIIKLLNRALLYHIEVIKLFFLVYNVIASLSKQLKLNAWKKQLNSFLFDNFTWSIAVISCEHLFKSFFLILGHMLQQAFLNVGWEVQVILTFLHLFEIV